MNQLDCPDPDCPMKQIAAGAEADTLVYPDLARANLLRMKADYRAAAEICLGILKRFPGNATAHTLLGDIYAEQGDLEQARQWYEMALEINPSSSQDRRKLEIVKDRIRQREAAQTAEQLGLPTSKPVALRYAVATAVIIVVVGVGAFFAGDWLRQRRATEIVVTTEPIVLDTPEPPVEKAVTEPPPPPAPERQNPPEAPRQPVAAVDRELAQRIRDQAPEGFRLMGLTSDPRRQAVIVTIKVQPGEDPIPIMRTVGMAVIDLEPRLRLVTVRALEGETIRVVGDVSAELLNAEREAARQRGETELSPEALGRLLTDVFYPSAPPTGAAPNPG